ncbi:MAG: hypothetical protein MR659_01350 [Mollicutes bacterium]|nr:hypothetical protein [Mollicutes bacterium]
MIIFKSTVLINKDLEFDEDFSYSKEECKKLYPLLEVTSSNINGYFYRDEDNYLRANVIIKADVILSDSLTCEPFKKTLDIAEDFEIMDKEDGEGEGYIFPSSSFELKDLCLCLIKTYVPLKPLKDN